MATFNCTILLFLLFLPSPLMAYIVLVDSYGEECFFEHVLNGTQLQLVFQVLVGGFLDIDVLMVDPKAKPLYHRRQATYGAHSFRAPIHGRYFFCFHNTFSTQVPKLIMFNFDYYDIELENELMLAQNDLEAMVHKVEMGLKFIKTETEYMHARTRSHHNINENSNTAIMAWAIIEYSLIVFLCMWQRYYILRFFEVRRTETG
ncbi:unnamed protein product [Nezara viridula]|uniref:GOLD domain-containing protein n=1 Tax=Nezara viridula TaxID=85310 RepID=A0A9P0HQC0_NEZVI|nr:unnamed protein product [Nezara viridula]